MAKSDRGLKITGSIDEDLTAYRMRGVEKIIIRRKGGPNPEMMRSDPGFINLRRHQAEFSGCSKASAAIRHTIYSILHVAEPFFVSKLTSLANKISRLDTVSDYGERGVCFSQNKHLLEGLNLNSKLFSTR